MSEPENSTVTECRICNQADNHPKHSHWNGDHWSDRHMDCCAAVGCDSCANVIKDSDGVKGDELRAHIQAKG